MNEITSFDQNYINQINEDGNAYFIIAQMTSLLNDTDNKVKEMEGQKWYQKMVKTVFGKNKATVKEIKENKEKLTSYMAKVIEELFKRQMIDEQAILILGNQINGVVEDSNLLKRKIIELAKKVKTIENSDLISRNICNDSFKTDSKLLSICAVLSQFNVELFEKQDHLDSIRKDLIKNEYLSTEQNSFKAMLSDFVKEGSDYKNIDRIYFMMTNIAENNIVGATICYVIENYMILSSIDRRGKNSGKIIERAFETFEIEQDVVYSTEELYDYLLDAEKDILANTDSIYRLNNEEENNNNQEVENNNSTFEYSNITPKTEENIEPNIIENQASDDNTYIDVEKEIQSSNETYFEKISFENMEEEHINSVLNILPGETKEFKNKNIHISAFINCEGTLVFDHCIIYYNESQLSDEINLGYSAKLLVTNSCFVCRGFDEHHFISTRPYDYSPSKETEIGKISFNNTIFQNCYNFLKVDTLYADLTISNCIINDCFSEFIRIEYTEKGSINIHNNVILLKKIPPFIYSESALKGNFIHIWSSSEECIFKNNYIDSVRDFWESLYKINNSFDMDYLLSSYNLIRIYGDNTSINNCTFVNTVGSIMAGSLIETKFERCSGCVYEESPFVIDNCVFTNCRNVIKIWHNRGIISNCHFYSCIDNIIYSDCSGGEITIEQCDFINIINNNEYRSSGRTGASIVLRRSNDYNSKPNYIKNCIFDGVLIKDSFLIAAEGYSKPYDTVTNITDCFFRNCRTNRSTGKLIKEYLQYDSVFHKTKEFHANIIDSSCKGMDKINKEECCTDYSPKTKSTTGNAIGITIPQEIINSLLHIEWVIL